MIHPYLWRTEMLEAIQELRTNKAIAEELTKLSEEEERNLTRSICDNIVYRPIDEDAMNLDTMNRTNNIVTGCKVI